MQKAITLLLLLLLSNMALADSNGENSTAPSKDAYVEIKKNTRPGPRSLTDVVAVGVVAERVVEVIFVQQLGDVTLTLSDVTGELDYASTNTANGSVLMMLPADATGEITITLTDLAQNQYVGMFTIY